MRESILDKVSIDFVHRQVLKNAYGNDDTIIAKLDPRTLILWYCFFGFIPWFIDQPVLLILWFLLVVAVAGMAKIAPLVLAVFCLGILSQTGYLFLMSLFWGGNQTTIVPLLLLTLKVTIVSLASVTVFSGLDPDKLADGLLFFGFPERLSFSIAYSYRILPMMMESLRNILLSFRLRGVAPDKNGIFGMLRYVAYEIQIVMKAFYPLMLNMAKKARTTVEALELKGYRYGLMNPKVRRMRLKNLRFGKNDGVFVMITLLYTVASVIVFGWFKTV